MKKIGFLHFIGYMLAIVVLTLASFGVLSIFHLNPAGNTLILLCLIQVLVDILAFYMYTHFILKASCKEVFGLYFKKLPKYLYLALLSLILLSLATFLVDNIFFQTLLKNTPSLETLYNENTFTLTCLAVIIAPLREELLFRGVLQPMITNKTNPYIGVILTALIFTGCHLSYLTVPYVYVGLFMFAITVGILRHKTKSIIPSYLVHLISNTVAMI